MNITDEMVEAGAKAMYGDDLWWEELADENVTTTTDDGDTEKEMGKQWYRDRTRAALEAALGDVEPKPSGLEITVSDFLDKIDARWTAEGSMMPRVYILSESDYANLEAALFHVPHAPRGLYSSKYREINTDYGSLIITTAAYVTTLERS